MQCKTVTFEFHNLDEVTLAAGKMQITLSDITSNIKSEMINTISITQNKRMFYDYLIKIEYLFADAGGVSVNSNC